MTDFFISIVVLVIAGLLVYNICWRTWNWVDPKRKGGKLALFIGLAIIGLAAIRPVAFVTELLIHYGVNQTAPYSPWISAFILLAIYAIGLAYLKKFVDSAIGLDKGNKKIALVNRLFYISLWVMAAAYQIGLASDFFGAWWLTWHVAIICGFAMVGVYAIQSWPNQQNNLAIPLTYLMNLVLTGLFCILFGNNITQDIFGSILFLAFLCFFTFLLFWLSYVLARPDKDFKKRISYWLVMPWTLLLCLSFGYVTFLQATHRLTKAELLSVRARNIFSLAAEDLEREIALGNYITFKKKAEDAYQRKDLAVLKAAVVELEKLDDIQRNIKRTNLRAPQSMEDDWEALKGVFKSSPPPPAASPDYIFLNRGEFMTFQLKAGKCSPWIRSPQGANQSLQRKYGTYKVCFRNGECYEPKKVPNYMNSDFKFCAIEDSDLRAVIE